MAMMEGVPQSVPDSLLQAKTNGEQVQEVMAVDSKPEKEVNGTNGSVTAALATPPVIAPEVQPDGDVTMGDAEPPHNGLLDATELLGSTATTHSSDAQPAHSVERVISAPEHIEQPVSDVRAETSVLGAVSIERDAMLVDQPDGLSAVGESSTVDAFEPSKAEDVTLLPVGTTPIDPHAIEEVLPERPIAPPSSSSVDALVSETKPVLGLDMSQSAGQVRQRDEDDESEPSAKRAKISPELDAAASLLEQVPASEADIPQSAADDIADSIVIQSTEVAGDLVNANSTLGVNSTTATMAAPGLPTSGPSEFDKSPLTKSQTRYLLDSVRKAKKIKAAIPFLNAVDPVALNIPSYPTIVPNPMDLGTIEEKLKTERYPSANALWTDFELMAANALAFNGANHPVTQHGLNLRAYFNKLMQSIPKGDAAAPDAVKKAAVSPKPVLPRRESRHIPVTKPSPTPAQKPTPKPAPAKPKVEPKKHEPVLDSNGVPVIRRASESERPKREIIKPQSKDMPYSTSKPKKKSAQLELKFCEQVVLREIKKAKNQTFAYPFMLPVDPVALNIPTYYTVIKKPMDFGTIERNLQKGEYANAKEFAQDARLVFKNCFAFNGPSEPVHLFGRQLEALFEELWEQKDEWIAANQPVSEPVTEDESADDEESEAEPETQEERMLKVVELQRQIAALTQQVIELTNAPLAKPKKKSKSKSKGDRSKKQKRPSLGTATPSSKTSKPKKAAKPRKLTLEQKRYVSEGIMMLDEVNMRKAVQMIRNGVPKLKDVNDDELELDVDEIPDPVLQTLHKFVKDYRRANGTDVAEDDDYEEVEEAPKHASSHRKKSKPMSAREQESRIAQVKQQLQQFEGGSGSDGANNNDEGDSSDDASSSSEEE